MRRKTRAPVSGTPPALAAGPAPPSKVTTDESVRRPVTVLQEVLAGQGYMQALVEGIAGRVRATINTINGLNAELEFAIKKLREKLDHGIDGFGDTEVVEALDNRHL